MWGSIWEIEWGAAADAQEHTVIHTPLVIGALCCSSSSTTWSAVLITSCVGEILEHCLCIFSKESKHISVGIWEICAVAFGPDWWEPMRLMAHRASLTWASECTRLLLWALSLALYLPSFLFLGGSAIKIKPGFALNYSSLYKTGACPVWLHFTRRSWLPSECQVEVGWHDTSLSTQTHVSPGPSMMQRLVINLVLKVKICHLHSYQSRLDTMSTCVYTPYQIPALRSYLTLTWTPEEAT